MGGGVCVCGGVNGSAWVSVAVRSVSKGFCRDVLEGNALFWRM